MLEVNQVYKTFNPGTVNEKRALNGVNLTLKDGDFVTVIGGNGAGKSTLLNLVAGVYTADQGSIVIDGQDVTRLPEHKREREEYRELLKLLDLGLERRLTSKVGLLSGGQRQALTLLMATLKKPKLLLLDEHTAALDPKTAAKVLDTTERMVQKDNLTTLMITHNMKDAIAHGNRLIMMYDGRVVIDIAGEEKRKLTVEQLLAKFGQASGSDEADDKLLLS